MVHSHAAIQAAFLVFCASRGKKNSTTDLLFLMTFPWLCSSCALVYSFSHYIVFTILWSHRGMSWKSYAGRLKQQNICTAFNTRDATMLLFLCKCNTNLCNFTWKHNYIRLHKHDAGGSSNRIIIY